MSADTTHRQGCPAAGGYGHGVEDCICGADTTPGLAPCPWCGEVPDAALDVRGTVIECPSCGTRGPAGRDAAEAVEAWQRRAPQHAAAWMHEEDSRRVISADQRQGHRDSTLSTYAGSVGARSINARPRRARRRSRDMDREEEIIRMAQEAGIGFQSFPNVAGHLRVSTTGSQSLDRIKRFAALVATKEREACAQECERAYSVSAVSYETGAACARFIRARGATDGKPT